MGLKQQSRGTKFSKPKFFVEPWFFLNNWECYSRLNTYITRMEFTLELSTLIKWRTRWFTKNTCSNMCKMVIKPKTTDQSEKLRRRRSIAYGIERHMLAHVVDIIIPETWKLIRKTETKKIKNNFCQNHQSKISQISTNKRSAKQDQIA